MKTKAWTGRDGQPSLRWFRRHFGDGVYGVIRQIRHLEREGPVIRSDSEDEKSEAAR